MKVTKHIEQLLRQGRKPKELVELGFPKSAVTRISRRLRKEKTILKTKAVKTAQVETQLSTPPESPEAMATMWQKVQSMADDLERIDSLVKALPEVTGLIVTSRYLGTFRCETCSYKKDGLCTLDTWSSKDEIPQGIGEPVLIKNEKPQWYIKPSPFYCAICPAPLESRLDDVEGKLLGDPLSGAREDITCQGCGSKGWISVLIKCTKCGRETYWGW
jgi:hypothetical protein